MKRPSLKVGFQRKYVISKKSLNVKLSVQHKCHGKKGVSFALVQFSLNIFYKKLINFELKQYLSLQGSDIKIIINLDATIQKIKFSGG